MVAKKTATIGIDLGGTKTLFGLFDEKFKLLEEIKERTHPDKDEKHFVSLLEASLEQLVKTANKKELNIVAVGAGCAGFIDADKGVIEHSPNIPFLDDFPLAAKIRKVVDAEVALGNDVQVGLYGEHQLGVAKDLENVIGIFLGTGIGGALIINGRLYRGATGTAGEIGHYLLDPMGPLTGSERRGTLDDVVSRNAIAADAAALAVKQWAPYLYKNTGTNVEDIKSGELAKAVKHGDEKVEELVRSRARTVGIALSNLVDFLVPDMIVLGGGLVDAMPELFIEEVSKGVREYTIPPVAKHVKIAVAKLGDHAVTAGAARMGWDRWARKQAELVAAGT